MRFTLIVALLLSSGCYFYAPYHDCWCYVPSPEYVPPQAYVPHQTIPTQYIDRRPNPVTVSRTPPVIHKSHVPSRPQKRAVIAAQRTSVTRRPPECLTYRQQVEKAMKELQKPLSLEDALKIVRDDKARRARRAKEGALLWERNQK
jgi:hypothetical protein